MFGLKRALVALATASLAVGVAAGAGAISLAALDGGATLTSGSGLLFENFSVKAKGKGLPPLDDFDVVATQDGFQILAPGIPPIKGKLDILYTVNAEATGGVTDSLLAVMVASTDGLKAKVGAKLIDPGQGKKGKKIGKLKAQNKSGKAADASEFPTLFNVVIQEKINLNLKTARSPEIADHAFGSVAVIPEPVSALLLGSGLAGLGMLGRRRRATRR